MTVGFGSILEGLGPGLNPQVLNAMDRLNAMTRLGSNRFPNDQRWMPMLLILLLVILIVALVGMAYNRIQRERCLAGQAFMENIRRRNLSHREYRLLLEIVRRSGLSPYQRGLILSSTSHFERGANRVVQEILDKQVQRPTIACSASWHSSARSWDSMTAPPKSGWPSPRARPSSRPATSPRARCSKSRGGSGASRMSSRRESSATTPGN